MGEWSSPSTINSILLLAVMALQAMHAIGRWTRSVEATPEGLARKIDGLERAIDLKFRQVEEDFAQRDQDYQRDCARADREREATHQKANQIQITLSSWFENAERKYVSLQRFEDLKSRVDRALNGGDYNGHERRRSRRN